MRHRDRRLSTRIDRICRMPGSVSFQIMPILSILVRCRCAFAVLCALCVLCGESRRPSSSTILRVRDVSRYSLSLRPANPPRPPLQPNQGQASPVRMDTRVTLRAARTAGPGDLSSVLSIGDGRVPVRWGDVAGRGDMFRLRAVAQSVRVPGRPSPLIRRGAGRYPDAPVTAGGSRPAGLPSRLPPAPEGGRGAGEGEEAGEGGSCPGRARGRAVAAAGRRRILSGP